MRIDIAIVATTPHPVAGQLAHLYSFFNADRICRQCLGPHLGMADVLRVAE